MACNSLLLNKMSLFHKNLVGVDIGSSSVKVVSLSGARGSFTLEAAASVGIDRPAGFLPAYEGPDIAGLLRDVFSSHGIRRRRVATVISGGSLLLRHLKLPRMPAADLAEAVKWELRKESALPADDMVADYIIHKDGGEGDKEKISVITFAAKRSEVEELMSVFASASLDLRAVDVVPTTLLRTFDAGYEWERGVNNAVLEIGGSKSSLTIMKEGRIEFTRDLHFGGSDLVRALTGALHTTEEEAEAEMIACGFHPGVNIARPEDGDRAAKIAATMSSVVEGLCSEIHRSVDYFQAQFRAGPVAKLYISGGTALIKGMDEFISETLGLICFSLDPFKRIKIPRRLDTEEFRAMKPSFALAAGLAMRRR